MKINLIVSLAIVAVAALVLMLVSIGFERIDAGYDGIRVNRYGDEKGVDRVAEVTGAVWFNKIKYDIYEVPTFVQDYNFEDMEFKTKDMLSVTLGAGIQVSLPTGQTPALFVNYRRYFERGGVDLTELIYKHTRQAFSDAVGEYKAENLVINKAEFRDLADSLVKMSLTDLNFNVQGLFLIGDPGLPEALMNRVNAKIEADQIAQQKENELRQAEADARKRIAAARGDSASMVINAQAQAKAYDLQARELSSLVIQKMFIDKWNGQLPNNSIVPQVFSDISGDAKKNN